MNTTIDVYTTSDYAYDGKIYHPNDNFDKPKGCLCFTSNHIKESKRVSNRLYDINTNSYKNLTTNKDAKVIELYNQFERYVLSKDKKIIRNFLIKSVCFKYKKRIIEIVIKQNELLVTFLKDAKKYDIDNKLVIRKGYEQCSLKYCLTVGDDATLKYAKILFDKLYDELLNPSIERHLNNLITIISTKVKSIDKKIILRKVKKGFVFTSNRNFLMIEKRKEELYLKLLQVEDKDNILNVVGRSNYEPLCRSFRVKTEDDINKIYPLIVLSYEMQKICAVDVKRHLRENS